jgi:hypothetical protein
MDKDEMLHLGAELNISLEGLTEKAFEASRDFNQGEDKSISKLIFKLESTCSIRELATLASQHVQATYQRSIEASMANDPLARLLKAMQEQG